MGFDVYGLNPNNPTNAIRPEALDWSKDPTEKERKEYFDKVDKYENIVVGEYFRNNVWYWRPLWSFVCDVCEDILSEKDMEAGGWNDGKKISKTKALKIAKRLEKAIELGVTDKLEKESIERQKIAKKKNEKVQAKLDKITKECQKEYGKDLVPAQFPEPYKSRWDKAYGEKSWGDSYPFVADNVKHFAEFCKNSGGFQIC